MKSLILKDLCTIGHNMKSMLFILLFFAVVFIPTSSAYTYIGVTSVLCGSMVITTFSFDASSKWTQYAMVMPITRRELVAAKFVVLGIFSLLGSLLGLAGSLAGGLALGQFASGSAELPVLLLTSLICWAAAMLYGGLAIPLVFKFGPDRGRVLMLVAFLIPAALVVGGLWLLTQLGIVWTERLVVILLCCSPLLALAWCGVMYLASCRIFERAEL